MPLLFSRSRDSLGWALACTTAVGLALSVAGCGTTSTLNGAGASFPAPIYQRWFQDLAGQGVRVNYQSVGSGAGVRQFISRTVDFAASDVPMKAEDLAKVPQGVVQIPMTAGAIAVAYQNKGCALSLSQAQLVGIFLGKINDYSQLGCAAKPIKVVVRSDGSGTTANFTAHLAALDASWKEQVGTGKSVKWPVGTGAKGNEGVAAQLNQVDGALGYVEAAFVKGPLQAAALTNAAGRVQPLTAQSAKEALASIDLGPNLTGANPNPSVGYPIVSFSWILLYKTDNGPRRELLNTVFRYTLSDSSQAKAAGLGFISLPPPVLEKSRAALATVQP
ncbi:MAG: phosphate ABC transporter substrate-binding protein PstS [Cyanobacteriota bacterium]|nr:phosphate ABC transporter substrate-binding protein PstS [Cyanobacteriota bacterium]